MTIIFKTLLLPELLKKTFSLFIFLILASSTNALNYKIEGLINLPESWRPVIYLSAINSLYEINTASKDFIINQVAIEANGNFVLEGNNLPDGDRLYRLPVCKNGDPPSTIIIGGQEENHIHFIMNNKSQITATSFSNASLFGDFHFDNKSSLLFSLLKEQITYWKNQALSKSETSRAYNQLQLEKYLRFYSDTCQHSLLKLIAINELDIENDYLNNRAFYHDIHQQLSKNDFDFQYFNQQLAFLEFKNSLPLSFLEYLLPILAIFSCLYF